MEIDIIETPIRFHFYGLSSSVPNSSFGEVGMKLMNEMWRIVKDSQAGTTGINHWVYLPNSMIFTGVELKEPITDVGSLETLEVFLDRYVKYLHVGPYSTLGAIWLQLMEELKHATKNHNIPILKFMAIGMQTSRNAKPLF